jgi:hypothetical protein
MASMLEQLKATGTVIVADSGEIDKVRGAAASRRCGRASTRCSPTHRANNTAAAPR